MYIHATTCTCVCMHVSASMCLHVCVASVYVPEREVGVLGGGGGDTGGAFAAGYTAQSAATIHINIHHLQGGLR